MSCNAQNQSSKEEKIRKEVNNEFDKNLSKCSMEVDVVTDFNGKREFWRVCNLKDNYRIIKIESHIKDTYYQEIYFEKKRDLIYAKETENYMPKNQFTQMAWNCEFYTKKGELITLISLGHGKTEDDEWNPEIIFEMYKSRLEELEKIKK
ncbi:hypothetical protein [uncultured Winogradskyella sp.]|uniref:hypothetical protein n=1 Tax=uncultured Winogradskyella sp. TaxID=395353 RepID=UPI0026220B35|nr:hypothetical protein [uncultured Winogradskyella sp.]